MQHKNITAARRAMRRVHIALAAIQQHDMQTLKDSVSGEKAFTEALAVAQRLEALLEDVRTELR